MQRHTHRNLISFITIFLLAAAVQAQDTKPPAAQKIVEQGISIEFTAEPLVQNATHHGRRGCQRKVQSHRYHHRHSSKGPRSIRVDQHAAARQSD